MRNSRASQYHDYREARTNLTLDGEVLEYALVAGFNELVLESDRDGDGSFESRYQDPQSWTLGSTGFLFWDPFTARPSTDACAIGMNPNNVLERLAAIPDLSTNTPLVSPEQRLRTYWSTRIDAGTTGPVRWCSRACRSNPGCVDRRSLRLP